VPPGEVFNAQTGIPPVEVREHQPVRREESDRGFSFLTQYGRFSVATDLPYLTSASSFDTEKAASMFTVLEGDVLLVPGAPVNYSVSDEGFEIRYGVYQESIRKGNVSVVYRFAEGSNKITVSFDPLPHVGDATAKIVWLTFTPYDAVALADAIGEDASFADVAADGLGRLDLRGLGSVFSIGDTGYEVKIKPLPGSSDLVEFDFHDAQSDWDGSYVGNIMFSGRSGNVVLVVFSPGLRTIDPKLIIGPVPSDATKYSIQRKAFFDGERYWAFWWNGTIKYASSIDGNAWSAVLSDVPWGSEAMPYSFTVANYGKTVAVLWIPAAFTVRIATGVVKEDWIKWDDVGQPKSFLTSGDGPVAATFTNTGELVFTSVSPSPLPRAYLGRLACVATNGVPCSTLRWETEVAAYDAMTSDPARAIPVAFNGDQGYVAVVYASPTNPPNVFVHGNIGTTLLPPCTVTLAPGYTIGQSDDPAFYMTATASGRYVSVFWKVYTGTVYRVLHYNVDVTCHSYAAENSGILYEDSTNKPTYLSAGSESDGINAYVFWTSGSPRKLYYTRTYENESGTTETPGWLASFTDPNYVTAAASASRFIPILTMKGTDLYYINWPLPFDGVASPQNPWAQLLGAPLFGELGSQINPAVGLVFSGTRVVELPGRQVETSVSIIYREPGLFSDSTESLYKYYNPPVSAYGKLLATTDQVIHLDLPWIDSFGVPSPQTSNPVLHLPGGQAFLITWQGPASGWFNNTKGVRFSLKREVGLYTLTFPSGATYEFDGQGRVTKLYPDVTRNNFLTYQYNDVLNIQKIIDNLGREVVFSFNGQQQLTTITYGNGKTVSFDYSGGVPTGCTGTSANSGTVKITDALLRDTRYYICKFRLAGVDFPTGGKVVYTYATYASGRILQGNDTYTLPILQMDVYNNSGAGTKTRSVTFTYHAQNGEIVMAELKFYDGSGAFQGSKQYRYRSQLGMSSTRILDASANQMRMDQNWYSLNDQPHFVETSVGAETEPSATSQDFVDDWGNPIYSKNALGNETFRSFANTNHQYQFYAPGSLKKTAEGKLYSNGFDFYSHDWSVVSGSPQLTIDDTMFERYMPALKAGPTTTGTHLVERTFAGATDVLLEMNLRTSSTARELDVLLNAPDGTLRTGIQFSTTGTVRYKTATWADCTWPSAYGGGQVPYRANTWYRLTIVAHTSTSDFSAYLDGIDVCNGPLQGSGSTFDRFRVQLVNGFSAWFDDVKVTKGTTVTVAGLAARQTAALVGASGDVLNQVQTPSGGSVVLNLNPAAATLFYETNALRVRVLAPDGWIAFESPTKRLYGGDGYTYVQARTFADELVRTRMGFGYWTLIRADDSMPGTPCPSPCTSWIWETRPTVSGTQAHLTPFDHPTAVREHGYMSDPTPYTPGTGDYHVQYVYLPPGQAPSQILLKYGTGSTDKWVSWGTPLVIAPVNLGPLPDVRGSWVQLLASASDAGTTGLAINAQSFKAVGGAVYWDGSALADSSVGQLTVTGLSAFSNLQVGVYWTNNDTLIASANQAPGADSVLVQLYSGKLHAFPVLATIRIQTTAGNVYYKSAPRYIWGGDRYAYLTRVVNEGFYDQGLPGDGLAPAASIHSAPLGGRGYSGDCVDALVCYDMESFAEDGGVSVGTGVEANKMIDWSGRGNYGTISGSLFLAPIANSASGHGAKFTEAGSLDAGDVRTTWAAFTVSVWAGIATATPTASTPMVISKDSWTMTPREGYNIRYDKAANAITADLWDFGSSATLTLKSAPVVGTMYHLVIVYDVAAPTARFRAYLNGVEVGNSNAISGAITTTASLKVGEVGSGEQRWNGYIDQVLVFDRAVSANEVMGLYQSRQPGLGSIYLRPTTNGYVTQSRAAQEGRYLVAGYAYDADGNLLSSTDQGNGVPGASVSSYYYSDFYSGTYVTRILRADGKEQITSYDKDLGLVLGTVSPDCRRVRNDYDAGGRPVATLSYDSDSSLRLYYDMETPYSVSSFPSASNLFDVSCTINPDSTRNTGFFSTSPPTEVPGVQGKARSFVSASSNYIQAYSSFSLGIQNSITLAAWINPTSTTGVQRIISKWGDTDAEKSYLLSMGDAAPGRIRFSIRVGTSTFKTVDSATTLASGTWYHVAGVYTGAAVKIYIDGKPDASVAATGQIRVTSTNLRIGHEGDGSGASYFDGKIDEVQVLDQGLSDPEIADLSKLQRKLVGRTSAAFDDMVSIFPTIPLAGYQFHSVTLYDEVSTARKAYYDMETKIARPPINPGEFNIEDLSGNGNHLRTSAASTAAGKLGQSLYFDVNSLSSALVLSDANKLNFVEQFTIAGWFDLTDNFNERRALAKWGSTDATRSWYLDAADLLQKPAITIHGSGASTDTVAGTSPIAGGGVWRFLAATFDRGDMKLYVDGGTSLTTFSKTSTIKRVQASTESVTIPAGYYGRMDEVQLLDRALTGTEIQNLYDSYAIPTKVKDKSVMRKAYFDGLGRETRQVARDFFGNKIETKQDLFWNDLVKRSYLPSGQFFSFTYDFLGRTLTGTTPGDANTAGISTTTYLDSTRRIEFLDPVGRKTYTVADVLGREVEAGVWNPFNSTYNVTRATYDAFGGGVTRDIFLPSGAKQQATASTYRDAFGLTRFAIYPNGKTATISYDVNFRVASATDEMGRATLFGYDSLGRVTQETLKSALGSADSFVTTYEYDASGNVANIKNGTAAIYRQFDARSRLTKEFFAMPAASPTSNLSLTYTYDRAGRLTQLNYTSSTNYVVYTYDSLGRVVQMDAAFGGSASKYAEVAYDAYNRVAAISFWNTGTNTSLVRAFSYDVRDRMTQIKLYAGATTYLQLNYSYNKASDIIHIDDTATTNGAKPHDYFFDGQGRLTKAVGPWGSNEASETWLYGYDAVGNIKTRERVGSGVTTYAYDYAAWNRLTGLSGATSETYTYNDAGSMLERNASGAKTKSTYDYEQRLVTVVMPNNDRYDFSYDGVARRLKTVETAGSSTTYFAYAGSSVAFARKVAGGTTDTFYVYLLGQLLFRKTGTEDARFYHTDLSSNVRLVTYYVAGTQVDYKYRYRPFGELVTLQAGSGADPKFKFAGQELDGTGLYHMGARYHDASVGRFVSRDPIGSGYAYAANNPLSFYDPTGMTVFEQPFYGSESYPDRTLSPSPLIGWLRSTVWPQIQPYVQPLIDRWNALPHWVQAVIVIAATVALIALTAGQGAWLYLAFVVGVGAATATAFVLWDVAHGETNGDVLIDAFVDGFTLGTTLADVAIIAYRGIVSVGARLAALARRGATELGEGVVGRWLERHPYFGVAGRPAAREATATAKGFVVPNPGLKVTSYSTHALEQMTARQLTVTQVENIVSKGTALAQGDAYYFIAQEGAVVLSKGGRVITAYGAADFRPETWTLLLELGQI